MKIIIAPARTMQVDTDSLPVQTMPEFLSSTKEILHWMRTLNYDQLHILWENCSTKLAHQNYQWLQEMNLEQQLTPALLAFTGLQYKYMAPAVFSDKELRYVSEHLRILSGFYGLLRPFDGIVPYRLGMGDRVTVANSQNLYEFWGDCLYRSLYRKNNLVLNLASKEYEKAVRPYLGRYDYFISCKFGELVNGKVRQKATQAKMARGRMVRYLAENNIQTLAGVKEFNIGYQFMPQFSTESCLTFVKR